MELEMKCKNCGAGPMQRTSLQIFNVQCPYCRSLNVDFKTDESHHHGIPLEVENEYFPDEIQ